MVGITGQEDCLFHCSITSTNDSYILVLKEKAVTSGTGANATPLQTLFAWQPQPFRTSASRDNNSTSLIFTRIRYHSERTLAEVNRNYIFWYHLGAKTAGLRFKFLHHGGA